MPCYLHTFEIAQNSFDLLCSKFVEVSFWCRYNLMLILGCSLIKNIRVTLIYVLTLSTATDPSSACFHPFYFGTVLFGFFVGTSVSVQVPVWISSGLIPHLLWLIDGRFNWNLVDLFHLSQLIHIFSLTRIYHIHTYIHMYVYIYLV